MRGSSPPSPLSAVSLSTSNKLKKSWPDMGARTAREKSSQKAPPSGLWALTPDHDMTSYVCLLHCYCTDPLQAFGRPGLHLSTGTKNSASSCKEFPRLPNQSKAAGTGHPGPGFP